MALTPQIDDQRSGRASWSACLAQVPASRELALAGSKEQFFLYLDRPVVNFGHARWMEKQRGGRGCGPLAERCARARGADARNRC